MKPYALKNFSENYIKDANIPQIGVNVWTKCSNIKDEYFADYEIKNGVLENGDDFVNVWLEEVDTVCIDPCAIEYCMGSDFDEWIFDDFVRHIIKPFDYYLVCSYKCTWDGASGYKIAESINDALYRNYDCSQYYCGGSQGGKSIVIKEYHHDVPMGHRTVIIGLTEKEHEKLSHWDINFETVFKFADEKSKSIIEI